MALDTRKLINYLAHGVPGTQIAAALGLTSGRVTQLAQQTQVIDLVEARKSELAAQRAVEKATLADARANLIDRIVDLVDETESLGEAVGALEKLQRLEEPTRTHSQGQSNLDTTIVTMPVFVQQNLQINTDSVNQITAIGDRSMATLPTSSTYKLIKETSEKAKERERLLEITDPPAEQVF